MEVHDIHSNIMSISETEQLIRQGQMCQNYFLELRRLKEPKKSKQGKAKDAKKTRHQNQRFHSQVCSYYKIGHICE